MASKPLGVDNGGTLIQPVPAIIDFSVLRPYVPVKGFQWRTEADHPEDPLLARKHGAYFRANLPPDLHLAFADLEPSRESILRFANDYGPLKQAMDSELWDKGERLSEWQIEIARFRAVRDLWYASTLSNASAKRAIVALPKITTKEPWILIVPDAVPEDPKLRAAEIVAATIDAGLTAGEGFHDYARVIVRVSEIGSMDLLVVATNLVKTLWLQVAAMVTGQRIVKKCEAPDCGRYMDVTTSDRPSARKMHPWCSERLRKQQYRRKLLLGKVNAK